MRTQRLRMRSRSPLVLVLELLLVGAIAGGLGGLGRAGPGWAVGVGGAEGGAREFFFLETREGGREGAGGLSSSSHGWYLKYVLSCPSRFYADPFWSNGGPGVQARLSLSPLPGWHNIPSSQRRLGVLLQLGFPKLPFAIPSPNPGPTRYALALGHIIWRFQIYGGERESRESCHSRGTGTVDLAARFV